MLNFRKDKESCMFKIVILATLLTLLMGCTSSKSEEALMRVYEKNKIYHKQLLKTEKIQLYVDNVTKVLLTATYLYEPARDKKQTNDEVFIVGIYADEYSSQGLNKGEFNVTLEGKDAKSVKPLDKNSPLLKDISFISEWSHYYLVRFSYIDKKSFKLTLSSQTYGKGSLHFAKVAKYVLTKKSF